MRDNLWPPQPTNQNYRMRVLKQFDYLLGFISQQIREFKEALENKWLKNHSDPKENAYESPICVYYEEVNTLVPMVKIDVKTDVGQFSPIR